MRRRQPILEMEKIEKATSKAYTRLAANLQFKGSDTSECSSLSSPSNQKFKKNKQFLRNRRRFKYWDTINQELHGECWAVSRELRQVSGGPHPRKPGKIAEGGRGSIKSSQEAARAVVARKGTETCPGLSSLPNGVLLLCR